MGTGGKKLKYLILIVTLPVLLGACTGNISLKSSEASPTGHAFIDLSKAQISAVQSATKQIIPNPETAKFTNAKAINLAGENQPKAVLYVQPDVSGPTGFKDHGESLRGAAEAEGSRQTANEVQASLIPRI